jgi:hypothetical protein
MCIRSLRSRLGAAFVVNDASAASRQVDQDLARLLPHWGFVQTEEQRWLLPPPAE